jgi:hypothetical protein
MQAVSTSEMLVNLYQITWCYISEDSYLHIITDQHLTKCVCSVGFKFLFTITTLQINYRFIQTVDCMEWHIFAKLKHACSILH